MKSIHKENTPSNAKPYLPQLHLCLYNHPFYGVSDQVEYFVESAKSAGFHCTCSRHFRVQALNFVIENFQNEKITQLRDFCDASNKRVGVIMTEHLDWDGKTIFFHGRKLGTDNDYMHPLTQRNRLLGLYELTHYISYFFRLGDMPKLLGLGELIPDIEVRQISLPALNPTDETIINYEEKKDFFFAGYLTDYRKYILSTISKEFTVECPRKFVSRRTRNKLMRNAKIQLNIPQSLDWSISSLMRILAGLNNGLATISLNTEPHVDGDNLAEHTSWTDSSEDFEKIKIMLIQAQEIFLKKRKLYQLMSSSVNNVFPLSDIRLWGEIEKIPKVSYMRQ